MTISLLVIAGVLMSIAGAFVLKQLEREDWPMRERRNRFSKRQLHRITEELGQSTRQ